MNFAAYQWRANKGYLPPPGSMPHPIFPSPFYWAYPPPQCAYPCQIPMNPIIQQSHYPGPVVAVPPRPLPASVASTPAPAPPAAKVKKTTQSGTEGKVDKSIAKLASIEPGESSSGKEQTKNSPPAGGNVNEDGKTILTCRHPVPSLRPGDNYLFPRDHTMLHIFNKAAPIWDDKYKGQGLAFKIFKVSTAFTVQMVIERVLKKAGGERKGWAATEVFECGDGGWKKGTTIEWGGDKAKGTLEGMGWSARRGKQLGPVWLVIHKL